MKIIKRGKPTRRNILRILFINEVCGTTSTGRIVCELADHLTREGHECKIAYGRFDEVPEKWQHYAIRIGNDWDVKLHALKTRLTDQCGFGSKKSTSNFLKWAEQFDPDVVWLHNLHGYYINIELLFYWIKSRPKMNVKWTLHDCWPFTGHCAYFTAVHCDKWKVQCNNCPQLKKYPKCYGISKVQKNFERKKIAFTGVKKMTLITPSKWLQDLVEQSFLKDYPVEVQYNNVNKEVFKPSSSNFRQKYNLQEKKIVLGVANVWDERKGLKDFLSLARMLDERFVIVLVGLNKKQLRCLPKNIIGLNRTNNIQELAEIYTAADIFVNPSLEETFGMTTVEALACGTKSIVYKGTACEEIVTKNGGLAIEPGATNIYLAITKCKTQQ